MAVVRERRNLTVDEVVDLSEEGNNKNSLNFDLSESELKDDGVTAVFFWRIQLQIKTFLK